MSLLKSIFVITSRLLNRKYDSALYRADFDSHAQEYDSVVTRQLLGKETEKLINELEIRSDMRCFDLGCGTGHATKLIADRVGSNSFILGCDVSESMLNIAKKKFENGAGAVFLKQDMLESLRDQKENSFDLVTAFWSLGYSEWDKVLKEVKRVLKDGRCVAVLVNTQESLKELQNLVIKIILRNPFVLKSIPPINFPRDIKLFGSFVKHVGLNTITISEGSCEQSFASGEALVSWMKTAGPCAGFRSAIKDHCRDIVFKKIEDLVNDRDGIKLTFRFIRFIGTK